MIDPQTGIILLAAAAALVGYVTGIKTARCTASNPCPKCAFHVNEGRMAQYEADHKRIAEVEKQKELRHNAAHKGWGWAEDKQDEYNCHDEGCARNRPGRGTYL